MQTTETGAGARAVIVLGMHRSGTSAVAGVLDALGVNFGEGLLPASRHNEKGYFERTDVMLTNEAILEAFGKSWDTPGSLPEGWADDGRAVMLSSVLQVQLQVAFGGQALWGVKDPRLCKLLPLWRKLLHNLHVDPAYVIVVRHPDEVAGSLAARDGIMPEWSHRLWAEYMLDAERHTRGARRVFVSYDALMADWRGTVQHLSAALGLAYPVSLDAAAARVDDFLSPALRHHRADAGEAAPETGKAAALARKLFAVFSDAATRGTEPAAGALDAMALEAKVAFLGQAHAVAPDDSGIPGRYQCWLQGAAPAEEDRQRFEARMASDWHVMPAFHLIVPLYGAAAFQQVADTIDALSGQWYPGWALTVVAPMAAPDPIFEHYGNLDWVQAPDPLTAVSAVVQESPAQWIAVMEAGTRLAPHALVACADAINRRPHWRVIYTDEEGNDVLPARKPDFVLERFREQPFQGSLCLIRRELIGLLDLHALPPFWWNYDVVLKLAEIYGAGAIGHAAEVLARPAPGGEEGEGGRLDMEIARGLVAEHLVRMRCQASVREGDAPGTVKVIYGNN